jgi:hypothetical protein
VTTAAVASAGRVTEKFSASPGRWLGLVAATLGAAFAVGALVEEPPRHWRVAAVGIALVLLSWPVLVRPAVAAHEHGLLMRNIVRDVYIPWGSVERCKALLTFQVVTPEGVVHGLGVTRSARSVMRQQAGGSTVIGTMLFGGRLGAATDRAGQESSSTSSAKEVVQSPLSYVDFVEARIQNLADGSSSPAPVVTSLAPVPVAALAAAVVLLLAAVLS